MPAIILFTESKNVIHRGFIKPARASGYVVRVRPLRGIGFGSIRLWPFRIYNRSKLIFGHFCAEDVDRR